MKLHEDGSVTLTPGERKVAAMAMWSAYTGNNIRGMNESIAFSRGAVLMGDPTGTSTRVDPDVIPEAGLDEVDNAFVDDARDQTAGAF